VSVQFHGRGDRQPDRQGARGGEAKIRCGKRIVGRKRPIAVDTASRLLMVNLVSADIAHSIGAQMILEAIFRRWPWVKHLFADGAYDRLRLRDKASYLDFVLEVIQRHDGVKGFEVQPRPWVVERTFS
jgi:hypothetical protein